MILDLHRQGAGVSAIARRTGLDRKTVRKVIAGGLEPPVYGPRPHRVTQLQPFEPYLRERLAAVPELTGRRLHRELTVLGYRGGYTAVTDLLREIRPVVPPPFELRFETPPGQQAQSLPPRRRGWTSPSSRPSSLTSPASFASSGCSPWCSGTAE